MKNTMGMALIFISTAVVISCKKEKESKLVEGYQPIYATAEEMNNVEVRSNESLENPGRIYSYENYLLVNDKAKGIHIYDNSNVSTPVHLSFVAITGNMDFSVREGILYADNITDLVLVDIKNPVEPKYVNRISGVFAAQQFPDEFGAFECPDPAKGIVIGWKKTMLSEPKCYR